MSSSATDKTVKTIPEHYSYQLFVIIGIFSIALLFALAGIWVRIRDKERRFLLKRTERTEGVYVVPHSMLLACCFIVVECMRGFSFGCYARFGNLVISIAGDYSFDLFLLVQREYQISGIGQKHRSAHAVCVSPLNFYRFSYTAGYLCGHGFGSACLAQSMRCTCSQSRPFERQPAPE
jgi:hypothetical protein